MIQLSRNYSMPDNRDDTISIKVVGVGGAGSNALDRVVLDGMDRAELIAMNTDAQSLASSVAATKVQLGRTVTRGLGAGGDPEVGYNAAFESADEIRQALGDARMVFVCAGLGGGTGSGAAPAVAQVAREAGSLVLAFATMPFAFEGKRRTAQANEALVRLRENADAVICFENDKMGDIVAPRAGIHQAFAAADMTISQSVRSIVNVIQRPGLIRIGFDDLLTALRAANGRCVFGFGESDTDNRAHDALTQALKNPLMDRGRMLAEARDVLVQVAGGPGMTLSEVEILMRELGKHVEDDTQIFFGTSVDGRMGNRLSVTIISSLAGPEIPTTTAPAAFTHAEPTVVNKAPVEPAQLFENAAPAPVFVPEPEPTPEPQAPAFVEETFVAPPAPAELRSIEARLDTPAEEPIAEPIADEPQPAPAVFHEPAAETPAPVEPQPRVIPPKRKPPVMPKMPAPAAELPLEVPVKPKPERPKVVHAKQEVLQFEPITRGRFEKSEPTIVEGQDLDVPTFLRKNIRVK